MQPKQQQQSRHNDLSRAQKPRMPNDAREYDGRESASISFRNVEISG